MNFQGKGKYPLLISLILILYTNEGVCQFVCPAVAELNTAVRLACTFLSPTDIFYLTPDGVTAATCVAGRTTCINDRSNRFIGTVDNSTQAYLEIKKVELQDEGEWICRDATNDVETSCILVLIKTPSCSITSDRDIHELYGGDAITLSIATADSYCTLTAGFQLKTGEETMELINNGSGIFNSTFNLSETHFGTVGLLYTCNNVTKEITCRNIDHLTQQMFQCSITSDPETDRLTVGEEESISVNIEDYFCSKEGAAFLLQTGERTVELGETATSNDSICLSAIFKVTKEHLGMVKVIFICNNVSRSFMCNGITAFPKETQSTRTMSPAYTDTESSDVPRSNMAVIDGATAAGVVVVVAVTIIAVYVVKRGRNPSKSSTERNQTKDKHTHFEMADYANTQSEGIRVLVPGVTEETGYINVSFGNQEIVKESGESNNKAQMISPEGYASIHDVKKEDIQKSCSGLPESESSSIPEHVYLKINEKST